MFGYVTLYRKGLADAEMDRYQAYYCGLWLWRYRSAKRFDRLRLD